MIRQFEPDFSVRTAPLKGFISPRLRATRATGCGIAADEVSRLPTAALWGIHNQYSLTAASGHIEPAEASLLAVKGELASRLAANCTLCARKCGVNRISGELGACGLGSEARLAEHYLHIAEEAPINPSYVLSFAGCGLRCSFCQQFALLNPKTFAPQPEGGSPWDDALNSGARSVTFVGGDPDESLPGILRFLLSAPRSWALPIVWNNHAYSTSEVLSLLHGIVDAYIPDLKFGAGACGQQLAGISDYARIANDAISAMADQGVPVIVRILVLPGHFECCHRPALNRLAALQRSNVAVSIRGQYSPDHLIRAGDSLDRRPTRHEVTEVENLARDLKLTNVDDI